MYKTRRLSRRPLRLFLLLFFSLTIVAVNAAQQRVAHVIDGDTVVLDDGRHVRLLAINTPEVKRKKHPAEPGGEAAKKWLKQQIEDRSVKLVADQQKTDKYGRSLFYLFDSQGRMLNEQLLKNGYATLSPHPPNLKYLPRLLAAQQYAETQRLGLWRLPAYQPVELQSLRKKHAGWQRIIATPQSIRQNNRYVRLALGPSADIRIDKNNLRYFPPMDTYLNQRVEVRGWASWRKDKVSILVRHPASLILLD